MPSSSWRRPACGSVGHLLVDLMPTRRGFQTKPSITASGTIYAVLPITVDPFRENRGRAIDRQGERC
jgi:hypothetical protein